MSSSAPGPRRNASAATRRFWWTFSCRHEITARHVRYRAAPAPGADRLLPDRGGVVAGLRPALRRHDAAALRGAALAFGGVRDRRQAPVLLRQRDVLQALALRRRARLRGDRARGGVGHVRDGRRLLPPAAVGGRR